MKRINTNCLAGMKCPRCGSLGGFVLSTTCDMTWHDDGTEDDGANMNFDMEGAGKCLECGHLGPMKEFDAEKHYVERGGNHCPYCNAEEEDLITEEAIQANGPNAWREMACRKCGMMWQDLFQLTGLGNYPDMDLIQLHEEDDG